MNTLSLKTVKTHVSNLAKLEVSDRTQAAVYAFSTTGRAGGLLDGARRFTCGARSSKDPESRAMEAYMRHQFPFLGIARS